MAAFQNEPQGSQADNDQRYAQTRLFEQARLQLARLHAGEGIALRDVWLQLAQLIVSALDVERVGVWVLVDEERALRCRYLFQRSTGEIFQGAILRAQDFPDYFAAIQDRRTLPASDAQNSGLTQELRDSYLQPLGISSLLDAPIYIQGKVVGVLCHEHVGEPRAWSGAECDFASAVADNIARIYQEHERHHAQSALLAYERHLMELHRMEAIGRVAAGIAHDFRGIFGAAMGYAELIRRVDSLPADADRYSQRIIEVLQRGNALTQEVVAFGKDSPVSPRVLDVGPVIQNLSGMLRVLLGNSIRFNVDVDRRISRIFIDTTQLERTLMNLVLNARDAMPTGGDLVVRAEDTVFDNEDGDRDTFVMITVNDSGTGMDEATRANIFKPFFTTKGENGTGLGLAIVDQIVARAGGFIQVDSQPNKGTSVRLFIPRIADASN